MAPTGDQEMSHGDEPSAAVVDGFRSALLLSPESALEVTTQAGMATKLRANIHQFSMRSPENNQLFGRAAEKVALLEAYDGACKENVDDGQGTLSFALVTGSAGIGKSSLVSRTLRPKVTEENGFFITYKFDQYQRSHLTKLFDGAFDDLAEQILERDEDELRFFKRVVDQSGELEMSALLKVMPSLRKAIANLHEAPSQEEHPMCDMNHARSSRRSALMRNLLKAVATERPTVFFVDDFQYAHPAVLDVLKKLAYMVRDKRVLFVVAYRSQVEPLDEFSEAVHVHVTEVLLEEFFRTMKHKSMAVQKIHVTPLTTAESSNMIVSILQGAATDDITEFVISQSHGNPLFIEELLLAMSESELADLDGFDVESMRSVIVSKCLDALLDQRILRQPIDVQKTLKVAAALGCTVNCSLVSHALGTSATKYLDKAVDGGILIACGSNRYCFGHGKLQEAAYRLIDSQRRKSFHAALGKQLWKSMSMDEIDEHLAVVLYQINLGVDLITNQSERYALASLMLTLGSRAAKESSFSGGAFLLEKAMALLGEDHWREEHDLSIALYNTLAETLYAVGDLNRVGSLLDEVLQKARTPTERLQAQCTKIYMLSTQAKPREALAEGLKLLTSLGEKLPKNPTSRQVTNAFQKVEKLVKGKTDESFLRMGPMTDSNKLACMKIMNVVFSSTFLLDAYLAPMLALKMVELTLKFGVCTISCFAFALYGSILSCKFNKPLEGYRYGQLSMKFLKKYKATEFVPRVFAMVYGEIHGFSRKPQLILKPLSHSYITAMETGDVEFAMLNANMYCNYAFFLGTPLSELKAKLEKVRWEMNQLNQRNMMDFNEPLFRMVRMLIGEIEADTQSTTVDRKLEGDYKTPVFVFSLAEVMMTAYLFGDHQTAEKAAVKFLGAGDFPFKPPKISNHWMFAVLSLVEVMPGRSATERQKYRFMVQSTIGSLQRFSRLSPDFGLAKLHLAQAELCAFDGKKEEAIGHYITAIAMAGRGGYVLEEALANERAGRFLRRCADEGEWGTENDFIGEAIRIYRKWGALAKVVQLETLIESS